MPAVQLARHGSGILRIIERYVLHLDASLPQGFGEVAHGAEYEGDLLRMMRNMASLLHHLDQQHRIAVLIQHLQRGEIER